MRLNISDGIKRNGKMAEGETQKVEKHGRYSWEPWLIIGMLVSLLILILLILQSGIPEPDVSVLP